MITFNYTKSTTINHRKKITQKEVNLNVVLIQSEKFT